MPRKKLKYRFAISPDCVRHYKELTVTARLVYIEIFNLSQGKGFCWASNTYLSEKLGVGKDTVSKSVNQLIKQGILLSEMSLSKETYNHRKLTPVDVNSLEGVIGKSYEGSKENPMRGSKENHLGGSKENHLGGLRKIHKVNKKREKENTEKETTSYVQHSDSDKPSSDKSCSESTNLDFSNRSALQASVQSLLTAKAPRRSMLPETQAAVLFWFAEALIKGKKSSIEYYLKLFTEALATYDFDSLALSVWIISHCRWMRDKGLDWTWMMSKHLEGKVDMALGGKYDCDLPAQEFQEQVIHQVAYLFSNPSALYDKAGIHTGRISGSGEESPTKRKGHTIDDFRNRSRHD